MSISVLWDIMETARSNLSKYLSEDVPDSDPLKAKLVRIGLLQDDPTRYKVSVLVQPNDQDEDNAWLHEIAPKDVAPPYQIGGGEMWLRRFTVNLNLFWGSKVDREQATQYGSALLSRAESVLTNISLLSFGKDDYGEYPLDLRVKKSKLALGGGEGQFISYGKIYFEVLTEKTRTA